MSGTFLVENCRIEDAPLVAKAFISANWTIPSWRLTWQGKTLEYVIAQAQRRWPRNLLVDHPHRRQQKAVDEKTGTVVGYARWTLPDLPGMETAWSDGQVPMVSEEQRAIFDREFQEADWYYDPALNELDTPIIKARKEAEQNRICIHLDMLAVEPAYWRRGIGTSLVQAGVEQADRLGLDIFVNAQPELLDSYKRLGFVILSSLRLDDYGGTGEHCNYFLLREARKASS